MQKRMFFQMVLVALPSALVVGCASTPVARNATPMTVFQQPIEQVQKAAVDSLVVTGFDVTKQEPTYVEGFRPRKMGFFVGSGGETVGIWLTSQGPNKTEVRVDTAKSFVGIVGQKNWETEILNEMTESLTK
jgi:type IV pilus biogenesis protein CpaD/CtpE